MQASGRPGDPPDDIPGSCPGDAEWSAFTSGELAPATIDRLAAHLGECASCQARLARLEERPDDAVILAIRRGTREGGDSPLLETVEPPQRVNPTGIASQSSAPPAAEGPGTRIGPYRLHELLGEGGFGSVFLAEQTHPVRRQVALKLVKLGMDTRQVLARFQAERQALAMMDHANIARVLDAGTTERGRPYFVMELAKGVPITEYCDSQRLASRKRLELFALVCDAVQHAHTKGVIHRDIKPTNVLVTMRDGGPMPKVIDFGIAKAIGGRLTDQTLYTEIRHFIGTPEYMSPEQADGAALDVDARTDVYSLGVLMYELLTGATPLDRDELRSKGIDRIGQTIREIEPPKPSTRVHALGATLEAVAARRGTDGRKLTQSLRGELDWIVMKCLEKDRTLRYETANALAMDVRRYLKDEPVRAGPPGAAYQVRKFVRRHRAGVMGAGAIAMAILLGLGLALYGWVRTRAERDRANVARDGEATKRARAERAIADRDAAAQARRLAQADAVATASPASVIGMLDALRTAPGAAPGEAGATTAPEPILAVFRQRMASAAPQSLERLRAARALALLGEPPTAELMNAVASAPASEGRLVISALAAAATGESASARAVVPALNGLASAQRDVRIRGRYAITLLFLGDDREARRALALAADPTPSSAFVAEFGQWHGEPSRVPELLRRAPDDIRGGLCLAAGRVDQQGVSGSEREAVVNALRELYVRSDDGGVHSACEHALRQWRVKPPAVAPDARPENDRGWFVNKSGLTMVRIPAGFNVIGNEQAGAASVPVLFTRPRFMCDREVPYELFRQFAEDPAVRAADKPHGWQSVRHRPRPGLTPVAVNMSLAEAARFCNWLSAREGRRPCYRVDGDDPKQWRCDPAADGYRVPTSPEWEYAARAGAGTTSFCCDDFTYLEDFAVVSVTGARPTSGQPNRWGLFDTAGGVWEICWDVDLAAQPVPPGTFPVPLWARPVVDPWPADGGRSMNYRGGAIDSGTFDLRLAFLPAAPFDHRGASKGFRVVCAAAAADAPPEVAPPRDAAVMWTWAADKRPEIAGRVGHALGRYRRFADAATCYAKVVAAAPDDLGVWYFLAVLRLHLDDAEGYRAACAALSRAAAESTTPGVWDRAAKAALLNPDIRPGPELQAAAELAARAVAAGNATGHLAWFHLVDGIAEYRAGRFEAALRRLDQARAGFGGGINGLAIADLFRAMALHRAGRSEEARAVMKAATDAIDRRASPQAEDWGDFWIDWLTCQVLRKEAQRVFGAAPDAARPTTSPASR